MYSVHYTLYYILYIIHMCREYGVENKALGVSLDFFTL